MNEIGVTNQEALDLLADLVRLGKKAEDQLDGTLEGSNLSALKLLLMNRMRQAGEPMSNLATHLGCVKSHVTQMVDSLEGNGLVKRVASPEDRRTTLLEITEKGSRHYEAALDAVEPLTDKLNALSPDELATLKALVQTVTKLLK